MPDALPFKDHALVPDHPFDEGLRYERRPLREPGGDAVPDLFVAWITLDNPTRLNAYTTPMLRDMILALRRASCERDVVAVVVTGAGERAFCTGGNTKEYAEYYSGSPSEYQQYLRLFVDMITGLLHCDKPVVCRVNGMRIAGGQEIGLACDLSVSSDLAVFGQAGPKHGSAPDGGSTDMLALFVGIERAMQSATFCEMWTAYEAERYGLLTEVVPVLEVDGELVPNPTVETGRFLDERGRIVHGRPLAGEALAAGKARLKAGEVRLEHLDAAVERAVWKLANTFPDCLRKTLESLRKQKLELWNRNKETSRSWLSLNMMTEGRLGFRAFNEGPRDRRRIDFLELRRRLAAGERWSEEFIDSLIPR